MTARSGRARCRTGRRRETASARCADIGLLGDVGHRRRRGPWPIRRSMALVLDDQQTRRGGHPGSVRSDQQRVIAGHAGGSAIPARRGPKPRPTSGASCLAMTAEPTDARRSPNIVRGSAVCHQPAAADVGPQPPLLPVERMDETSAASSGLGSTRAPRRLIFPVIGRRREQHPVPPTGTEGGARIDGPRRPTMKLSKQ